MIKLPPRALLRWLLRGILITVTVKVQMVPPFPLLTKGQEPPQLSHHAEEPLDGVQLPDAIWLCTKDDGYRGIWYWNQRQNNEYVYKYSGGLGTYCAHHYPFAVYVPEADKTFFCYGGAAKDKNELIHMVSYFDHKTGQVPRPIALLNKKTDDAHDNPVISVDAAGHIWIFSSAHGTSRRSYISVSKRPYDIDDFELVSVGNFSYPQVYFLEGVGFLFFHTWYLRGHRILFFTRSEDGRQWETSTMLSYIEQGHYQVSAVSPRKIAAAFNYHPSPQGLNWRTNLYYVESTDFGATWQAADGTPLCLPLTEVVNPALVHDYAAEDLRVYLVDMVLDQEDNPVIVYITSRGWQAGPDNDPRIWHTARWDGRQWVLRPAMTSDNNYDNGSLYIQPDGRWILIAPTERGPQPYNTGGEVAMWESTDLGASWKLVKPLTAGSEYNHGYCRRPIRAHPQFYSFWADGHGRKPSDSRLYFCDLQGNVYRLPSKMDADFAFPELVLPIKTDEIKTDEAPKEIAPEKEGLEASKPQNPAATGIPSGGGFAPGSDNPPPSPRPDPDDGDGSGLASPPLVPGAIAPGTIPTKAPAGHREVLRNPLPAEFTSKVAITPDFCQTDPIFRDLPEGGANMCGPTAFANILFAMEKAGATGLVPEADTPEIQARALLEELTSQYLKLTTHGIGPAAVAEGVYRFLNTRGYPCRVEWRGWRRAGEFRSEEPLSIPWICESVLGNSWAILNVGWYRYEPEADRYRRFGGHWVTLVGFRTGPDGPVLLVHDPARRSGPGKVTHDVRLSVLQSGTLASWPGYPAQPGKGMFRLEGLVLNPHADCALLDGVIRIEVENTPSQR